MGCDDVSCPPTKSTMQTHDRVPDHLWVKLIPRRLNLLSELDQIRRHRVSLDLAFDFWPDKIVHHRRLGGVGGEVKGAKVVRMGMTESRW